MKPCRFAGCKRVAIPPKHPLDVNAFCLIHYVQIVTGAYSPKNESVAMDAYIKRQYGR